MKHPEGEPSPISNPGDKYETIPTRVSGIELIIEKGAGPRVGKKVLETFSILGNLLRRYKAQAEELNETIQTTREEIIKIVEKKEGLRGITHKEDNLKLTAFPREVVRYDPGLLKKSLGSAYSFIAREELVVTMTIPPDVARRKEITQRLKQALTDLGINKRDLRKVMKTEIHLDVDDETLMEMIEEDRAKLLAGARETKRSWTVKAVDLKRERKVAEEEARPPLSEFAFPTKS